MLVTPLVALDKKRIKAQLSLAATAGVPIYRLPNGQKVAVTSCVEEAREKRVRFVGVDVFKVGAIPGDWRRVSPARGTA